MAGKATGVTLEQLKSRKNRKEAELIGKGLLTVTIGPSGRVLGYERADKLTVGYWLVRLETERTARTITDIKDPETGKFKVLGGTPKRAQARLGLADDVTDANGVDVLSYDQAYKAAMDWAPPKKAAEAAASATVYLVEDAVLAYANFQGKNGDKVSRNMVKDSGGIRWNILLKKSNGEPRTDAVADVLCANLAALAAAKNSTFPADFPKLPVNDLTREHLHAYRLAMVNAFTVVYGDDDKAVRGYRATVRRVFGSFISALNQAFDARKETKVLSNAEWQRLPELGSTGNVRDIHYTPEETPAILKALESIDPEFGELCEAGFLTGARYGELCAVTVAAFDERSGTLTIPHRSERDRCKTGFRVKYLSPAAIAFCKRVVRRRKGSAPLFSPDGENRWDDFTTQSIRKKVSLVAALKAAGLREMEDESVEDVFYCFRHTHISRALENGAPIEFMAKNCGTSEAMIKKHYAKYLASHNRRAAAMLPALPSTETEMA